MLPFPITLKAGAPIFQQIVYAIKIATVKGHLKEGDRIPSVRAISKELGVNPNTVQKAIAELASQGILEVHAGRLGCRVAPQQSQSKEEKMKLVDQLVENLIVESQKWGFTREELQEALDQKWQNIKSKQNPDSAEQDS